MLDTVQVKMLRALNATDKADLLSLLLAIENTFSPYWDNFKSYITLQQRVNTLRDIINDKQLNDADGTIPTTSLCCCTILKLISCVLRSFV
jgi:hypothetical protein